MSKYLSAIVVPCLNEQDNLTATCQSLGFGAAGRPPTDAVLILVDNGSDDATVAVAKEIQARAPTGSVIVTTEPDRGYVPPRRHGNRVAMAAAADRGVTIQELLIIQADADTSYSDGYVEAMAQSARQMGPGVMVDSRSEYQTEFLEKHHAYIALCDEVDAHFESELSDQSQDVIVDDKACAYWASDYESWGGHQREYTSQGDEIHSETARLYIRARTYGAVRCLCDEAIAKHSDRRLLADPAYGFATAGFPREQAFKARWGRLYDGPTEIVEFCKESNRSKIALALRCRRAHVQGLFQMLTTHVRHTIEPAHERNIEERDSIIDLPRRDVKTARDRPGLLVEDVLGKVDGLALTYR